MSDTEPNRSGRAGEEPRTMSPAPEPHSVLAGGGEMGERMRAFDWSRTPMGPVDAWPTSLRALVRLMLDSRQPMFLWWGPELTQFYNDGYRQSLGDDRHPAALGATGREFWSDAWPVIGPEVESMLAGGPASWHEDALVPIPRNGQVEDVYWTYGYTPVRDDSGGPVGVLVTVVETTREVTQRLAHVAEIGRSLHLLQEQATTMKAQAEELRRTAAQLAERTAAAEAARRLTVDAESRYRALLDSLDVGFCVFEVLLDDDGRAVDYRFLETNPAFEQQTGLVNAVGRRMRELVPDIESHWFEIYGRVARTGEPTRLQSGSDAMGRWFDLYAFRTGATDARQVGVLFTDVTAERLAARERDQLVTELREANDELRRLNEDAQATAHRAQFLADLGVALQPLSDPEELTATAARLLGEHLGADRCAYAEVETDEDHFAITGNYVREGMVSIEGRFAMSAFGADALRMMHENRPWVVEDAYRDPRVTPADREAYEQTQIRAVISVPLHKQGRFVAGTGVHQRTPRAWTHEEVDLAATVTQRLWESIERARAHRRLREREAALEAATAQLAERTAIAEAAQRAAEAANHAKSEFLAVMSHELRTPLNAIGGYAEIMELGIHGPITEEQRADLARIRRSQMHLLGLINEVLNYAKLESGAVRYDLEDVPVHEVIAGAEGLVAPQARSKGLTLRVTRCASELAVRADADKLRQVLVNLLSNAVKFTRAGGTIELSCATHAGGVHISVRDTGIGIAAEKLEAIFEPFVQVRAGLTRTAEGTGLGLAISRDLTRGMGGDLTVESVPREGSTFTVTLPRA